MTDREVPADIDAERAVLGAMLLSRDAREQMTNRLAPDDFYRPLHAALFRVICELHMDDRPADRLVLIDRMHAQGVDLKGEAVLALQAAAPTSYNAGEYATLVERAAISRRLITPLQLALTAAWDGDPLAAMDAMDEAQESTIAPFDDVSEPIDAHDLAAEDHEHDWLIPALLARHEEVLIVAEPGSGKTTWLNQFAVLCSAGLHPWFRTPMSRLRCLVFDMQDSRGARGRQVQWLLNIAGVRHEPGWLFYELRTQGIDLTRRNDQRWFEAKVARVQPDLIIAGPLYNMVRGAAGRSKQSEETAELAGSFLSQLLVRRNCSIIVEAHAPHGDELRVRGSKYWEDWAGFGHGFKYSVDEYGRREYQVTKFRGDREADRQWPSLYVQGHPGLWPWEAPPEAIPPDPARATQPLDF